MASRIWLCSAPGEQATGGTENTVLGLEATGSFGRALVVEDDQILRRALVRALRAWGVETHEACDVKSAHKLLRLEPDLVVTDVRLPDGTGHEVARRAARLHTAPFIVAMSGEASPEEAFALARASVQVYLEKPFTVEELQARIGAIRSRELRSTKTGWDDSIPEELRAPLLAELRRVTEARRLTPRESDVLRLSVVGVPRTELADALGVTENTCKTLVKGVLRKCGLRRMAQCTELMVARVRWQQAGTGQVGDEL